MTDDDAAARAPDENVKRVPVLSLFADVREGEAWSVLVLTLNVFVLLCAYYLLKVAREPLILLGGGGAAVKTYASGGQALILAVVTPLYGVLASRLPRVRLITTVTLFFVANLAVFIALLKGGVAIGVPFFLWVGVFNYMVIAQFWAFAADIYSNEQGKRLFPVIGIGSTVGAIAGTLAARQLQVAGLGASSLMLVAGVMLAASLVLTLGVHARSIRSADAAARKTANAPIGGPNGFQLLMADRYLWGITGLAILINCVNTVGEYLLDATLLASAPAAAAAQGIPVAQFIGVFKANFFLAVNVTVTIVQMFVVSRVIKHLGLAFALAVVPIISLAGYMTIAIVPILTAVFVVKVAENSLDYSLQNTARQTLWLVTTRAAKYKAKLIIDTFFVRNGDVLASGVVFLTAKVLSLGVRQIAPINAALVCVWLAIAVVVARQNKRRAESAPAQEAVA